MSKQRVQLTLSNKETLELFNELKYKQPVKMTNDDFLKYLLSLTTSTCSQQSHTTDDSTIKLQAVTLSDVQLILADTINDFDRLLAHTLKDYITKEKYDKEVNEISEGAKIKSNMILDLQNRVVELENICGLANDRYEL